MKKIFYILSGLLFMLSASSCEDWLDVNDNPNSASTTVPTPDLRLRSILMQFTDAYESSGTRSTFLIQNLTMQAGTAGSTYAPIGRWDPPLARATWPYQAWFVYCAANLQPLIDKATAEEAWHYVGAAELIHAWGFMLMVDYFGEMPYTEALSANLMPKYDDGKTIFNGCMDMLDKAIEDLSKPQPASATALSRGDWWLDGDAQKWIKLAYGLKARWLNNLSKKKDLYNPDAILEAVAKGPQSNADNTVVRFLNTAQTDRAGIMAALQHTNMGGTGYRTTKWFNDLLLNTFTGGSGVQDPRATRMIPSGEFNTPTGKEWRLSKGVDLQSDIRVAGGPVTFEIMATAPGQITGQAYNAALGLSRGGARTTDAKYSNRWYSTNQTASRMGDSVYISIYADRFDWTIGTFEPEDDRYLAARYNGIGAGNPNLTDQAINVTSTGSFYLRADGPAHLVCYHEMCFIKAEVLLRKGDKTGALQAYKDGIRAHMEAMNEKLKEYPQVLGKEVISAQEISDFLSSAAVAQTAAELTMAKIMQQKQISMQFTMQNWNDMRRFNYAAVDPEFGVVYPDFARPAEYDAKAAECYPKGLTPNDVRYWPRRFQQCTHELTYNLENMKASNREATERTIISCPVWWDCATDEEYYGYIKD
jgi:hypothetical protein